MTGASVRFTPRNLSDLAWGQWLAEIESELEDAMAKLREQSAACEATRPYMDYKTGSIPFASAMLLYTAVRHVKPICIFEIGTFIGKSTLAMALAADLNQNGAEIYTCDGSNDFHVPALTRTRITGFSKTTSTAALRQVAQTGKKLDFIHVDGRLAHEDFELLEAISDPKAVIALDDFEGIEKGVANHSSMRNRPFFQRHVLVYPPKEAVIERLGLIAPSTTAFVLPSSALSYSPQ
jgi:predicted O-methyltransferase YrrM